MKKFAFAVIVAGLISSRAFAAGMTAHMFMSEKAMELVSTPELKALLHSQKNAVMAGSIFPDTGNGLKMAGGPSRRIIQKTRTALNSWKLMPHM